MAPRILIALAVWTVSYVLGRCLASMALGSSSLQELADSFVVLKAWYWVDALKKNQSLADFKTEVLDNCRIALLENGYTVSAETNSNIAVVRMPGEKAA